MKKLLNKIFIISFLIIFVSCGAKISYEGAKNASGDYHGQGVITFLNGEIWEGEFKNGEPYTGKGIFLWSDSSKFEGEIVEGLFQGQGTYTYSDGKKWTGNWKDDKRFTGKGIIRFDGGEIWEGEWKEGIKLN